MVADALVGGTAGAVAGHQADKREKETNCSSQSQ